MTTPPRTVSIAAIMASVVLGVVLLVGALEIPVPALRIQVEIGGTQPPPADVPPTAVAPVDGLPMPHTVRPKLINENEVEQALMAAYEQVLAGDAEQVGRSNQVRPKFTPMSYMPELLNGEEVIRAVRRAYPPELREAGVGGSTTLLLRIGPDGDVIEGRVDQGSGFASFDAALLSLTDMLRFAPARNRDQAVPVWVRVPITMQVQNR